MKLRSILSLQAVDVLRGIASLCEIPLDAARNKTVLIDLLCRSLPEPGSVATRLADLETSDRDFVVQVAAEGGELLEQEALEELSGGFVKTFQSRLSVLSRAGLVFQDAQTLGEGLPLIGIPEPLLRSIPVPQEMQGRLRNLMRATSLGLLRAFAKHLGLSAVPAGRHRLIREIRSRLLGQHSLGEYVAALPDPSRAILDLFLQEHRVTRDLIRERLGENADRELDELLWRSPIFHLPRGDGRAPDDEIRLAPDLALAFRQLADSRGGRLESHPHEVLDAEPTTPSTVEERHVHLQRDLATLVGLIGRRSPRLLKRGGISKSSLREMAGYLQADDDPGYPEFLMLFAESGGLVKPDGQIWVAADRVGRKLEDEGRVRKALLTYWLGTDRWNEWTADRSGAPGPRRRAEELKGVRRAVIEGLHHCEVNRWVVYPKFYKLLVRTSEVFRTFADGPGGKGAFKTGGTTADELLRRMLRGALGWIGVVQLGNPDAYATPLHQESRAAFQVTELGRALATGNRPQVAQRTNVDTQFIIQPNLEILSPPDLPFAQYVDLHRLADLRGTDVVAHFDISRHSLHEALNRGMSTRAMRRFLRANSATGVPDMVESMIDECDRKHGEVEIHAAPGYVSVEDEGLLDEIFAQASLAELLDERLSPVAAALRQTTRPEALFRILKQSGYLPRQSMHLEMTRDDHHQIVLRSSELAELVGLLETTSSAMEERAIAPPEDLRPLLRRLKRGLRHVPDTHRDKAQAKYQAAFAEWGAKDAPEDAGEEAICAYRGRNPATASDAVRRLISYAIDNGLWVEIEYPTEKPEDGSPRVVEPVSEDHAMVYGYCRLRRGDRVFRLDKIRSAGLRPRDPGGQVRSGGSG